MRLDRRDEADAAADAAGDRGPGSMPVIRASGLEALVRAYLTEVHRDDAAGGCPVAALAVDASRTAAAGPIFEKRYRAYLEW